VPHSVPQLGSGLDVSASLMPVALLTVCCADTQGLRRSCKRWRFPPLSLDTEE
jgi:hypothetical protein